MASVHIRDAKKRHREKRKSPCVAKGRDDSDTDAAKKCLETPEAERGEDQFSPRAFRVSVALLTP
jgi:hypothetical protein